MPLPLIPVLIGGAALLAGGYGVKKGLDAKENFDRAKDISADAQRIYDDAVERLEDVREETQASLEDLGRKKISIHKKFLLPFIETAQKLNTPPAKAGGFTVATKVAFRLKPVWPLLKQAEVIPPQFGRFHLHLPVA